VPPSWVLRETQRCRGRPIELVDAVLAYRGTRNRMEWSLPMANVAFGRHIVP